MKISDRGIDLIKKHEGLRLTAYLCPAGIPTIGYGHTKTVDITDVARGTTITEQQAVDLLRQDLKLVEIFMQRYVDLLSQNEFDSCCSFAFNVGCRAFSESTLLKRIKAGAPESAIRYEFSRWNKSGTQVLPGLVKRRQDEADLFFSK